MILCEKPLARDLLEAQGMVHAIEKAGVANTVWYNYRRLPAVMLAHQIIASGKLGKIYHYRANFLQDWTINASLPQGGEGLWRMDAAVAGSGVLGDLLSHCIDTAMWLNGGIRDVTAMTETFVRERVHQLTGKMQQVTIDDACSFLCRFENGSLGVFESTRYARGHKALYTFEINGANASIRWDLHDLNRLEFFDNGDEGILKGWRSIHVTDGDQPYMDKWWVPGLGIGYEHSFVHQVADFLKSLETGSPCPPSFRDALETQKVCQAVSESAVSRVWKETGVAL
jgi:predicted dehydrogenase